MELKHELARRFKEVILDGTFIANTNYRDQLEGLYPRYELQVN